MMSNPDSGATAPVGDFDSFYRSELARLVVVAIAVSGDPSRGEDIAQEALTRAEKRWPELSSYDRPGAWVRRVTVNLAISWRRRLGAEARAVVRIGAGRRPAAELHGDPAVWSAVAQLPRRQRAVIVLHYLEDRPVAEIAEILEVSPSAVTSSLHKGRTRLAGLLSEEPDETTGVSR